MQNDTNKVASFDMGKGEMAALTSPPVFTDKLEERAYLKERLCAAIRIFADQGYDHTIAGHLTVRDPVDPTSFWFVYFHPSCDISDALRCRVNPFGLAFALMTVSDLILVSHEGKVIGGGKPGRQIVNVSPPPFTFSFSLAVPIYLAHSSHLVAEIDDPAIPLFSFRNDF